MLIITSFVLFCRLYQVVFQKKEANTLKQLEGLANAQKQSFCAKLETSSLMTIM